MAVLRLPGAASSTLRFEVYSASQAADWWNESPIGSGNVDDNNNLVWATNVDMNSSWLVHIINTGAQAANFQFAFTGPLVP